jgi:subtilisin family serine protease
VKPAWSWQFEPKALREAPDLGLGEPITREWAWGGASGSGVRVAVLDSGVEDAHPRVGRVDGAIALEYDADVPGSVREVEGPHADLFGHGTACAAIIRAIAPGCEIHSIRVLGERLTGRGFVFAAGVRWAVEHGMHVANLSLSTGARAHFGRFHELVDLAYFRRTMLVSAIANVSGPSFPSEFAGVFSVASIEGTDPFGYEYNPNGPVEWGAPGIDLDVAWLGGGSIRATGNSFAAPQIAGLIALILSKHPGLTPFQVKTILAACSANAPRPGTGSSSA